MHVNAAPLLPPGHMGLLGAPGPAGYPSAPPLSNVLPSSVSLLHTRTSSSLGLRLPGRGRARQSHPVASPGCQGDFQCGGWLLDLCSELGWLSGKEGL